MMNINSLHIRVSLAVAAAALVLVLGSSLLFYKNSYEDSLINSQRSVLQLMETLRPPAAIAAYVGNRELAQQVVGGLVQNDILVGARILANNELLGAAGKAPGDAGRAEVRLVLVSPFDEQEQVGSLMVVPNLALIALRARDAALAATASLAALAVVVALLVMIMVYWMMSRPLARLSTSLHRIVPGDGKRLAAMQRSDEIGLLVSDINSLLGTVEKMLDEERQLRHRVEQLENRFRSLFEDSSAGIFLVSEQGQLVTANPAFYQLTGLQEPAAAGHNLLGQVFCDPLQVQALVRLALISKRPCSADLRLVARPQDKGEERWIHCIFSPAGLGNQQHNTVEGVMYDITQRKKAEEHTRTLAETDSLTGLANRQAVETCLAQLFAQGNSEGFALLMLDLDRFKYINDSYGHDAGDKVLRVVAERLEHQVRDTDLVARLGGDEFLLLLKHTDQAEVAERIARQILAAQAEPIEVQPGQQEVVGMSIGIALYPVHGDNPLSLRKHADQALYSVKRRGKNAYALYTPEAPPAAPQSGSPEASGKH